MLLGYPATLNLNLAANFYFPSWNDDQRVNVVFDNPINHHGRLALNQKIIVAICEMKTNTPTMTAKTETRKTNKTPESNRVKYDAPLARVE